MNDDQIDGLVAGDRIIDVHSRLDYVVASVEKRRDSPECRTVGVMAWIPAMQKQQFVGRSHLQEFFETHDATPGTHKYQKTATPSNRTAELIAMEFGLRRCVILYVDKFSNFGFSAWATPPHIGDTIAAIKRLATAIKTSLYEPSE
jgi:hypothetical protein